MKASCPDTLLLALLFGILCLNTPRTNALGGNESAIKFPRERPADANFNRPRPGETLDISPPGFCWWRAGERGKVLYRLRIKEQNGKVVYASSLLQDPVHVPDRVLPPGTYTWTVSAFADGEQLADELRPRAFSISKDPIPMPWVAPEELLRRVPTEHPRLLFPKAKLPEIRKTLATTRKSAFEELQGVADEALALELMRKPDFDKYDRETQYAVRRVAYREAYRQFTRIYQRGMLPMALMYVLGGEREYGEAAKAHLLNLLDWETDGIASLESSFDEIGLRIARTAAQGYDWLYDLLSDEEREAVKQMLIAHGNQMLGRLNERDFLNFSGYSHDGRLPGYLVEFSIALAEEPEARAWMDYAMRALMTVFPHWAGEDGGWAEGINYALSYSDRFITPLQSLYAATGCDLWQKPFFRKFRYFLMYTVAPRGEILPFGDGEHRGIAERADELVSILQFHALRYGDPTIRWWIGLVERDGREPERLGVMHRILLPDTVVPKPPGDFPPDRAFFGIGWAALHSNPADPDADLMVMFKSSPFGPVSHSHADQNSFAIMKGGKALAIPGGERYPQHGSPFHQEYTQQTIAHNALLINGKGQINRDGSANGRLVDFKSLPHLGYVAGEAQKCYGDLLNSYVRHVVLIRPALVLIVDDLEAPEPIEVQWLMHAKERLVLDERAQKFVARRGDARMTGCLLGNAPLSFGQTNEWPVAPKKDYPMVTAEEPARQWHFNAKTTERRSKWRIAAILAVGEKGDFPDYELHQTTEGIVEVGASFGEDRLIARINLAEDPDNAKRLMEIRYKPAKGRTETIRIP